MDDFWSRYFVFMPNVIMIYIYDFLDIAYKEGVDTLFKEKRGKRGNSYYRGQVKFLFKIEYKYIFSIHIFFCK